MNKDVILTDYPEGYQEVKAMLDFLPEDEKDDYLVALLTILVQM